MDRLLYIAMNGAKNAMHAQQTNANNLANASTVGFKADLDYFQSMPVYGPGHASRAYANDERAGIDFAGGATMSTGRDLDVRINGDGWFVIQADDGTEALSRRGDFHVDQAGLLYNGAGKPVLGQGGLVTIPDHHSLVIGNDGTISVRGAGEAATALTAVDKIRLVNPAAEQLKRGEDGLFRNKENEPFQIDETISVTGGALESSNVNTVDAMVKMMEYARFYEMQTKMMKTANENDQASSRLMKMS
ncbi:MAG: flagellar basal body rod protein FlgF [Gammaproteobacteria bacterium]|nr:flagellar basal body rod protein FlgF [Gammaproteobacteria bacterium]